ncbi:CpXC domain-containing protein [Nocardia cyriacigeorgica]|uniref:hypothetical protein n=1 Tax=Nocardia cyriacigeorgica TaxID=135487 RepID=UPI0024589E37|nr:hypothetical protein [Nocardia cyriacigeorgica]
MNSMKAGIDLQEFLSGSMTTRRLDVSLPWGSVLPLFVHWSDGTDLDALDLKIASDKPHLEDFDGAIVVTDTPVECPNCHAKFVALTLEQSVTPVADMVPRYREHIFLENCPNCGRKWRADIVEIIARRDNNE